MYILPSETEKITPEDLERFPPVLLGDETAARKWMERACALDEGSERPDLTPEEKRQQRKAKGKGILGDLLFYAALAAFVLGVFLFQSSREGAPTTFMGFSAMRVLTSSMEREIPQGSLIITQHVDPKTLEVGDDITYLSGLNATITHRIVAITENYSGSGQRAFTTQGIMNESPDSLLVPEANVVGKVIFHSLALGKFLYFVRQYWMWLLALAVLFVGLCRSLRVVFSESKKEREEAQGPERREVPSRLK